MRRSFIIALVIALVIAGWLASGLLPEDEAPPPTAQSEEVPVPSVRVRTLTAQDHVGIRKLFGRTEPDRSVSLRAQTVGRVGERAAVEGLRVEEEDLIVRLEMDDRRSRLREAEALVEQRRIAYEAAKSLSKREFHSKVKLAEELALLEAARARLEAIRLDMEWTEVRAPFDGVVQDLMVYEGDYLEVGDEIAHVVDLDPIIVVGEIAERDVAAVNVGDTAQVSMVNGQQAVGTIRYVSRVADETTRTFRIEVAVDNPDGAIGAGLTVDLRLPLGRARPHLVSPAVLALDDAGRLGVKVVGADDRVEFASIKLLDDTPEGMWIGGLPETARLITVGQEFVREGEQVVPVPEAQAARPGDDRPS